MTIDNKTNSFYFEGVCFIIFLSLEDKTTVMYNSRIKTKEVPAWNIYIYL